MSATGNRRRRPGLVFGFVKLLLTVKLTYSPFQVDIFSPSIIVLTPTSDSMALISPRCLDLVV